MLIILDGISCKWEMGLMIRASGHRLFLLIPVWVHICVTPYKRAQIMTCKSRVAAGQNNSYELLHLTPEK